LWLLFKKIEKRIGGGGGGYSGTLPFVRAGGGWEGKNLIEKVCGPGNLQTVATRVFEKWNKL